MSDENESTELATMAPPPAVTTTDDSILWDPELFAHAQRVAAAFAASKLVPQHLQGDVASVLIALNMARRLGQDPLAVMQAIHVIHGRPGWSAQYVIALCRRSGLVIEWDVEDRGEAKGPKGKLRDLAVTAYNRGDPDQRITVTMQQAIDDGWAKNDKYRTLPELMLRYRSATLLARLYRPEIMLGLPTAEEVDDVQVSAAPQPAPQLEQRSGMAGLAEAVAEGEQPELTWAAQVEAEAADGE